MTRAPDFSASLHQFSTGHGLMGLCQPGHAAPKTFPLPTYRHLPQQMSASGVQSVVLRDWKLLSFTLLYILKHGEILLAVWVFVTFFFSCGFTSIKVLQQILDHFSFLIALTLLTEKCIYYCCCSPFLSNGDAIFSLILLLFLGFSIVCNQQARTNIT